MSSRNSNRYGSHLHQRDARSQLFENSGYGYPGDGRASPRVASAYRPATPNSRGQYSASVLEELESQNDAHVEGLSAKVKMLKDVCRTCGAPGSFLFLAIRFGHRLAGASGGEEWEIGDSGYGTDWIDLDHRSYW